MTSLVSVVPVVVPNPRAAGEVHYDLTVLLPFGSDSTEEIATLESLGDIESPVRWQLLAADTGGDRVITAILRDAEGDLELVSVPGRNEAAALAAALPHAAGTLLWIPPAGVRPDAELMHRATQELAASGADGLLSDACGLLAPAHALAATTVPVPSAHPSRHSLLAALAADLTAAGLSMQITRTPESVDLTPVLLSLISGRCGSTLMMQLLATSGEIALDRVPPFENNYLGYLSTLAGHIALPVGTAAGDGLAGAIPFPPLMDRQELSRRALRGIWHEFSAFRREGQPEARFWAEKFGDLTVPDVLPPARVLVLVRDPRDIWCSINSFDDKRGYYGFGRSADQSRTAFLEFFLQSVRNLVARRYPSSAQVLRVRYEDLATDLPGQAVRIGGWLGTHLDADQVLAGRDRFADHMTSSTPAASVARWRRELPADEAAIFTSVLGTELRALGYPES
jgi:hypothetical protein